MLVALCMPLLSPWGPGEYGSDTTQKSLDGHGRLEGGGEPPSPAVMIGASDPTKLVAFPTHRGTTIIQSQQPLLSTSRS